MSWRGYTVLAVVGWMAVLAIAGAWIESWAGGDSDQNWYAGGRVYRIASRHGDLLAAGHQEWSKIPAARQHGTGTIAGMRGFGTKTLWIPLLAVEYGQGADPGVPGTGFWYVGVRYWFLLMVAGPLTWMWTGRAWRGWREWKRMKGGFCRKCGYNLYGNVSGVCPECGVRIEAGAENAA